MYETPKRAHLYAYKHNNESPFSYSTPSQAVPNIIWDNQSPSPSHIKNLLEKNKGIFNDDLKEVSLVYAKCNTQIDAINTNPCVRTLLDDIKIDDTKKNVRRRKNTDIRMKKTAELLKFLKENKNLSINEKSKSPKIKIANIKDQESPLTWDDSGLNDDFFNDPNFIASLTQIDNLYDNNKKKFRTPPSKLFQEVSKYQIPSHNGSIFIHKSSKLQKPQLSFTTKSSLVNKNHTISKENDRTPCSLIDRNVCNNKSIKITRNDNYSSINNLKSPIFEDNDEDFFNDPNFISSLTQITDNYHKATSSQIHKDADPIVIPKLLQSKKLQLSDLRRSSPINKNNVASKFIKKYSKDNKNDYYSSTIRKSAKCLNNITSPILEDINKSIKSDIFIDKTHLPCKQQSISDYIPENILLALTQDDDDFL
ncbi:unnamed protein product [Gordionus sp. m RMFG-2023]|uniref:uncharacterized protein LOC135931514 n=1 Tax=Gordionus sp. m RMFG-2023 TaxID=3053472 RepID=UPI0030E59730